MLPPEFTRIVGPMPDKWPDDIGLGWLKMMVPLENGAVVFSYKRQFNEAGLGGEFYRTAYCGEKGGSVTLKVSDEGIVAVLFNNAVQTICCSHDFTDGETGVTVGSGPLESGEPIFILDYSRSRGKENMMSGVFCSKNLKGFDAVAAELGKQLAVKSLRGEGIKLGRRLEYQGKTILEIMVRVGNNNRLVINGLAPGWPLEERGTHFVNLEPRDYRGLALDLFDCFGTTGGATVLEPFLPDFFNKIFLYQ